MAFFEFFPLFLIVWIRIGKRNTDPDPQSCWIRFQFRYGSTKLNWRELGKNRIIFNVTRKMTFCSFLHFVPCALCSISAILCPLFLSLASSADWLVAPTQQLSYWRRMRTGAAKCQLSSAIIRPTWGYSDSCRLWQWGISELKHGSAKFWEPNIDRKASQSLNVHNITTL